MQSECKEMKKALYSLNSENIEIHQTQLQLRGQLKDEAEKWIEERQQVVNEGQSCLEDLNIMAVEHNQMEIFTQIKDRVQLGEKCLQSWREWIHLRSTL